jgi:SRSO17 transposase
MDTYIGQQELQRKRNADQFERDLKRAELESLSAQIPSKIELQKAQADYYRAGGSGANRSNNLTKSILDEIDEMVRLEGYKMDSPEFMQRRNELIQIYLSSGPVGLFSPQGGIDSMEALLGEIR